METKWTKGSWGISNIDGEEDINGIPFIEICFGESGVYGFKSITQVQSSLDEYDVFYLSEEDRANANLISAAPELYDALYEVVNYQGGADHALDDEYVVERIATALRKARGESHDQ